MKEDILEHARVLVVDDEPQNVRYLEDVLRWAGYRHIEGTTDPRQVLPIFRRFQPDLVILDLLMPEMGGFEVLDRLQERIGPEDYLPILILTSDVTREARRRALSAGARDFLTKPMSPTEVGIRVGNLLEARFLHLRCRSLEEQLRRAVEGGGAAEGWEAVAEEACEESG